MYGLFQLLSQLQLAKEHRTRRTDDVFSCYVLVGDASGHIGVYTTEDTLSNVSQTTSANSLSDRITMGLGGQYLALSTCDLIAQDAF